MSSPPRKPTRAVLLDAFGTLVTLEPPAPRLRAELRRTLGVDVSLDAAEAAFRSEIGYYLDHHLEGSDQRSLDLLRDRCAGVVVETLGLDPRHLTAVRAAMLAAIGFTAYPDAAPALAELRASGVRLVVASNWDCSLPSVLEAAGLASLVDGVIASASIGSAKPDPAVFEAALARAGAAAHEALHVGDSLDQDVAGARRAGVRALLIDRDGAALEPGVETIGSLDELPALLLDAA